MSNTFSFKSFLKQKGMKPVSIRPTVYIAGPFAGNVEENTENAVIVGNIAHKNGFGSIVPHTMILHEVYGKDEVPEERENGCISTLSIIAQLAKLQDTQLWIIKREDGSLSMGTQSELDLWLAVRKDLGYPFHVFQKTFIQWIEYEKSTNF
jgi:hypothetical protein